MDQQDPKPRFFETVVQVGAIVADIEKSIEALSTLFGIGPFRITDWPPAGREDMERRCYGEPSDFTARMAFAEVGPIELELIQPVSGRSIWADFLAATGGGTHHIRFNVEDMAEVRRHMSDQGIGVAQSAHGIRKGTEWANLDTVKQVGFTIEVMQVVAATNGRMPMIVDGKVVE